MKWLAVVLAGVVVGGAVALVVADRPDAVDPAPTEAAAPTTTNRPAEDYLPRAVPPPDGSCDRLNGAAPAEAVRLDGAAFPEASGGGSQGCVVQGWDAPEVTVTGTFTGDLLCLGCDGWTFDGVTTTVGSLRMVGGADWVITGAHLHGGNRGLMAVVGTGATDEPRVQHRSPQRWRIEGSTVEGAGCRPPGDPYPTHVRALYVIGANGVDNAATVTGSTFLGQPCGAVVKIGSTANFGVHRNSPDAADGVAFTDNTVAVEGPLPEGVPDAPLPILIAGHSDDVHIVDNVLSTPGTEAVSAAGPFTGSGLVIEGNRYTADNLVQWKKWRRGGDDPDAYLSGDEFVTYEHDPCDPLGTCRDNVADSR